MLALYMILAAVHIISMFITGILWTVIDLRPQSQLRPHLRDIRAVHFGSLWLVPWFLGLGLAFDRLQVPPWHQAFFPIGLGLLVLFSGIGWLFPRPPGSGLVLLLDARSGETTGAHRSGLSGVLPLLDCGRFGDLRHRIVTPPSGRPQHPVKRASPYSF